MGTQHLKIVELEREAQPQLHNPRSVPRRNRESPIAANPPVTSDDTEARIPEYIARVTKLRGVCEIEDFPVKLQRVPLLKRGRF